MAQTDASSLRAREREVAKTGGASRGAARVVGIQARAVRQIVGRSAPTPSCWSALFQSTPGAIMPEHWYSGAIAPYHCSGAYFDVIMPEFWYSGQVAPEYCYFDTNAPEY